MNVPGRIHAHLTSESVHACSTILLLLCEHLLDLQTEDIYLFSTIAINDEAYRSLASMYSIVICDTITFT